MRLHAFLLALLLLTVHHVHANRGTVNLLELVAVSVKAADHAGTIVRDIMKQGDLGIVDKGINDLQTEADRSAQRFIVASLLEAFPNVTVVGEEGVTSYHYRA